MHHSWNGHIFEKGDRFYRDYHIKRDFLVEVKLNPNNTEKDIQVACGIPFYREQVHIDKCKYNKIWYTCHIPFLQPIKRKIEANRLQQILYEDRYHQVGDEVRRMHEKAHGRYWFLYNGLFLPL
jgi:hypothetical protein